MALWTQEIGVYSGRSRERVEANAKAIIGASKMTGTTHDDDEERTTSKHPANTVRAPANVPQRRMGKRVSLVTHLQRWSP